MQKARRQNTKFLRPLVGVRFQVLFHPLIQGYFSSFPHGTCSLSVSQEYLALPDGAGRFRRSFTCSDLLRILLGNNNLPIRDFHPLRFTFPGNSRSLLQSKSQSYNPYFAVTKQVWAIPRSLATTDGIIIIFSSSGVLRCFSSPRGLLPDLNRNNRSSIYWVAPFGNLRISTYLQLTEAYRSLNTSFIASESQDIPHNALSNFFLK